MSKEKDREGHGLGFIVPKTKVSDTRRRASTRLKACGFAAESL